MRALPAPQDQQRETLSLPGGQTIVEWRRSKRARRVSLRIDPGQGAVVITLPMRAGRRAGMALLMGHADWVTSRLAALPTCIVLADGAELPIAGVTHRIRHIADQRFGTRFADGEIEVSGDPAFIGRRVRDFLRSEARRRLSARVTTLTARTGINARRVSVKDTSSRWGSCSADRTLSFSWRLLMAPDYVQEYVVAHEVAHLRHMNHGDQFWRLVADLTPHQDAAKDWLRRLGPGLLRVG